MIAPGKSYWACVFGVPEDRTSAERFYRQLTSTLIAPAFRRPEFFAGIRPGRRLRPVCFDILLPQSDPAAGRILRKRVEESLFLILLCSSSTARSEKANELATMSKSMGRGDDVIAVILEGDPLTADRVVRAENCLPPALRYPPPMVVDARPEAGGISEAVLRVLAEIAGTIPETFLAAHDRYIFRRRLTLAGATIALASGLSFWSSSRPAQPAPLAGDAGSADRLRTDMAKTRGQPDGRSDAANIEPGIAWMAAAREAVRWNRPLEGALLAARALGFRGYGIERLNETSPENHARFAAAYPDLFSSERREEIRAQLVKIIEDAGKTGFPYWSGPSANERVGRLLSVAFSPDGTQLACGSDGDLILVHDLRRKGSVLRLRGEPADLSVTALAFSSDGVRLGIVGRHDTVLLANLREQRIERTFGGFGGPIHAVAFHPDGRKMAAGGAAAPDRRGRGMAHIWSLEDSMGRAIPCETPINVVAFSADGKRLLAGGESLEIFDAANGRLLQRRKGPPGGIRAIVESPDGRQLAAGGGTTANAAITLWDSDGNETLIRPPDVPARVTSLRFSADSRTLIAGHTDGFIRVYRLPNGDIVAIIAAHRGPINAIDLSPDGRSLASVGDDGTARLWNVSESRRPGRSDSDSDAESQNTDFAAYVATGWYAVGDRPPLVNVGVPVIRGFLHVPAESHVGVLHAASPGEEERRLFEYYLRCSAYDAAMALLDSTPELELDATPLARHATDLWRRLDGGGMAPLFFERLARSTWGRSNLLSEDAIARLALDADDRRLLDQMRASVPLATP